MKTIAAFVLLTFAAAAQDRMAETLRKGIIQEETRQDLNAAIKSYESVLAQFGEERKTAAAALFRLAESYRKLGKREEAIAAYKRLTLEFGDQTALARQSRSVLQTNFQIRQEPASSEETAQEPPPDPKVRAALARYGAILRNELELARQYQEYVKTRRQLGELVEDDLAEAERNRLRIELQLAAFSRAGTVSRQLAGPDARAREEVRPLLEEALDLANQELARAQKRWNLGELSDMDVHVIRMKVLEMQLRLAAFDAGLPEPVRALEKPSGVGSRPGGKR